MLAIRHDHRNHHHNHYPQVWSPFAQMAEMEKQFFSMMRAPMQYGTDITDEGDHYLLKADLPGFAKEDIQLDLNGDALFITAKREEEREQKDSDDKFVRRERFTGSYRRRFHLRNIDQDGIRAKYENGVLQVTLPKRQAEAQTGKRLLIE